MTALNDAKSEAAGMPSHVRDDLETRLVRKIDLRLSVIVLLCAMSNVSLSFLLFDAHR
jgi:hypothetical protein